MTREEIRSVAVPGIIGLVLMVGVGVVFRLFISRQPEAEPSASAAAEVAAEPVDRPMPPEPEPERLDPPVRCIVRPLTQWTPSEVNAYPQIRAWLERQAQRILPWEWSNEALAKDPSGYCRLWRDLCWELEVRMLVEATGRVWGSDKAVETLVSDADLLAIAGLRRSYEAEEQLCATDARPSSGDLRNLEPKACEGLVRAIVRCDRR